MKSLLYIALSLTTTLGAQVHRDNRSNYQLSTTDSQASTFGIDFLSNSKAANTTNTHTLSILGQSQGSITTFADISGAETYNFNVVNSGSVIAKPRENNSAKKHYSSTSTKDYSFKNNKQHFLGFRNHASGEILDPTEWTVISAITKKIEVDQTNNQVALNISGMYQANNETVSSEGIISSVGFFIDDKLVDVKPMFLDLSTACVHRQFMITGMANNLPKGTHTVKYAIRNISAPANQDLTLTYGAPNPSAGCNTITRAESAISSTIVINQPAGS